MDGSGSPIAADALAGRGDKIAAWLSQGSARAAQGATSARGAVAAIAAQRGRSASTVADRAADLDRPSWQPCAATALFWGVRP